MRDLLPEKNSESLSTLVAPSSQAPTKEEKYPLPKTAQLAGYPVKSGVKFTAARKLQALRQHVLEDPEISAELAYYVPPNGQSSALSTQSEPLQPWIEKEFLHSDARVLLLKAPGGAGKSTFNRHLLRQLWQDSDWAEWKPSEVPPTASVPIFIPLGSSQVNPKRLLVFLSNLPEPLESFTDEEINVLKEDYNMLLIADGYDEIPGGGKLNLYDVNGLDRYAGRVKLLISSRDFIGRENVESYQLVPHHKDTGRAEYRYYRERFVSPFTELQIADYLERYLSKNKDRTDITLWSDVVTYQKHFKALPELQPLITAPFLLWIAAEALPTIVQGVELELKETQEKEPRREEKSRKKEPDIETKSSTQRERKMEVKKELKDSKASPISLKKTRKEITCLRLYAQFMEQWFHRQAEKAVSAKELLEDPEALLGAAGMIAVQTTTGVSGDLLAAEYLKQAYRQFCQLFANYLQASNRISVQYPAESKRRGRLVGEQKEGETHAETSESTDSDLSWSAELFGTSSKDWQHVRKGCPLRQSAAHEHQFLHASLIDYFVATISVEQRTVFSEEKPVEKEEKDKSLVTTPSSLQKSEPKISRPIKSTMTLKSETALIPTTAEPIKSKNRKPRLAPPPDPASQRLLDQKTIGFRVDELKEQPGKSQHYLDLIERSKIDHTESAAFAASNAATVLNCGNVSFSYRSWAGVKLPGADLSYSVLANSDLRHANLRGACLSHTIVNGLNLQGADLQDVEWGEQPKLELKQDVIAIAHHPAKPWLALVHGERIMGSSTLEIRYRDSRKLIGKPILSETATSNATFSHNGRLLAYGSKDNKVYLWKVDTQEALGNPLIGHTSYITSVAFSPDDKYLASASNDRIVWLWSVATQTVLGKLSGIADSRSVAFSPDGRYLASGGKTVQFWDILTRTPLGDPPSGQIQWIQSLAFSPDGQYLAAGCRSGELWLWNVATRKVSCQPLSDHISSINSVVFSPDSRLLVSASDDRTVRLWDVVTQTMVSEPLVGHTGPVKSIAFSPDGQLLISGGDKTTRLWKIGNRQKISKKLTGHMSGIQKLVFSPNGKILASGGSDCTIWLWDVASQRVLCEPLLGHTASVRSIVFSPDGGLMASGGRDGRILLWDVETKTVLKQMTGHEVVGDFGVESLVFDPSGQILASAGGDDATARLWDITITTDTLLGVLKGKIGSVWSVAFSPDGKILAIAGGSNVFVELWDVATRTPLNKSLSEKPNDARPTYLTNKKHEYTYYNNQGGIYVTELAFSRDSCLYLGQHNLRSASRWNFNTRTIAQELPESELKSESGFDSQDDGWNKMVFDTTGQYIACTNDRGVHLWDITKRRYIQIIHGQTKVNSMAFSPHVIHPQQKPGEYLLALGDDAGVVSFWTISHSSVNARFLDMPVQPMMVLGAIGTQLKSCHLNQQSQGLLEQAGAEVNEVNLIKDDVPEVLLPPSQSTANTVNTASTTTASILIHEQSSASEAKERKFKESPPPLKKTQSDSISITSTSMMYSTSIPKPELVPLTNQPSLTTPLLSVTTGLTTSGGPGLLAPRRTTTSISPVVNLSSPPNDNGNCLSNCGRCY